MKSFYKEEDETVPVNVYGKSKVAAEKYIAEKCSNFAILRSSIIFGPQTLSPVPKSLPIQVCAKHMASLRCFCDFGCLGEGYIVKLCRSAFFLFAVCLDSHEVYILVDALNRLK